MGKALEEWTDARLDGLAEALDPLPAQVAALTATVERLEQIVKELEPVPTQLAVLAASMERFAEDNRGLRDELAATQRQFTQVAWALVAALVGAAAAVLTVPI
jgi:ABC-type transporter Mla subunit MlaD